MAFGAGKEVWGGPLLPEAQRNLATIALTIAKYEPVSMLVREEDYAQARILMGKAVDLIPCPLDDLWMRDIGPVFVITEAGEKACVDFNFSGWGEKQDFDRDVNVAGFVAKTNGVERIRTRLVLEGGGIEVDGRGTAIIAESCSRNARLFRLISTELLQVEAESTAGHSKNRWPSRSIQPRASRRRGFQRSVIARHENSRRVQVIKIPDL